MDLHAFEPELNKLPSCGPALTHTLITCLA